MGPFSQALAAINSSVSQLQSIQGLPTEATAVQSSLCQTLDGVVRVAQPFQADLLNFVGPAITTLNGVIADLQKGATPRDVVPTVSAIAGNIAIYQQKSTSLLNLSNAALQQISSSFTQVSQIEGSLHSQMASLQAQAATAQGELSAAEKRYYYLLALGPFGLVGLATALALYLKWKDEASSLQDRINSLNGQIDVMQNMVTSCRTLATTGAGAVQNLTNLKNAVDVTAADIVEVLNDLKSDVSSEIIQLRLRTCTAMLVILQADAS